MATQLLRSATLIQVSHNPITDAPGQVIGVGGVGSRDITERKRAEEALREAEQQFRGMFERHHEAIMLLIDPDSGAFVNANVSWRVSSGFCRWTNCAG